MAEKVRIETGLCVMPHICCRDKNAIAIRSTILGARLNQITNFLLLTGDPVPVLFRQTTKSVFNFDSVGMMKIVQEMNGEEFKDAPVTYGGAINHNRTNIKAETERIRRKMAAGAAFFHDAAGIFKRAGGNRPEHESGNRRNNFSWNYAACQPEKCCIYEK